MQLATSGSASCRGKRRKHGGKLKEKNKSAGDFGAANLEFHVHFISSAVSELREPILCLRKAFHTPGLWKQREGGSLSPASNRIQPQTLAQILQATKGGCISCLLLSQMNPKNWINAQHPETWKAKTRIPGLLFTRSAKNLNHHGR